MAAHTPSPSPAGAPAAPAGIQGSSNAAPAAAATSARTANKKKYEGWGSAFVGLIAIIGAIWAGYSIFGGSSNTGRGSSVQQEAPQAAAPRFPPVEVRVTSHTTFSDEVGTVPGRCILWTNDSRVIMETLQNGVWLAHAANTTFSSVRFKLRSPGGPVTITVMRDNPHRPDGRCV